MPDKSHANSYLISRSMREQKAHTLAIMRPANRLRQRRTNVDNLQLLAPLHLILHRHRVRDNHSAQLRLVDRLDGAAAEDAVRDEGDDFSGAVGHDGLGGFGQGAAGVGHVVDEDGDFVEDVAD